MLRLFKAVAAAFGLIPLLFTQATSSAAPLTGGSAAGAGSRRAHPSPAARPRSKAPAAASPITPAALSLIRTMQSAYRALQSFTASGEYENESPSQKLTYHSQFAYKQPNLLRVVTTIGARSVEAVSDGSNLYALDSEDTSSYLKVRAPGSRAVVIMADNSAPIICGVLSSLLVGQDPLARFRAALRSLRVVESAPAVGVPVQAVVGTAEQIGLPRLAIRLDIGAADHLLRRFTLQAVDLHSTATETYSDVHVNPDIPAATFHFAPPAGAEAKESMEPQMYDPRLKVGAAPTPFSAVDLTGQPVSLDQYLGKVLLLDFWATWCGPCRGEVPNVVAAYKKHHADGFDVLGISLDRSQDKETLLHYTREQGMVWRQVFDGKYWNSAVAQLYKVQAIPFTLLIGRDGKIAAVGARGELLEPAIVKALAAKP